MEIISWQFLLFCSIVLAGYYLLSRRAQNIWLLLASLFFYATWRLEYVLFLLVLSSFNFFIAQKIENKPKLLWVGLLFNVGLLMSLKFMVSAYGNSLIDVLHLPGTSFLKLFLPVGFAFYGLQAIAYLVDVAGKRLPASRDWVDFSLFLAYFPKLLSGPVERAAKFLPMLAKERLVDNQRVQAGITLILTGLVRKVVISGLMAALMPPDFFKTHADYSNWEHLYWLAVMAFNLYNDFAGYSSLVRGISLLMGFELTVNFKQPFFARSFTDFWNRWHISLSAWLRDTIFFPFFRALRKKGLKTESFSVVFLPAMLTMLISGLWHGVGLGFVLWGLLHGLYQVFERALELWLPRVWDNRLFKALYRAIVFVVVTLTWVPFFTDFSGGLTYWFACLQPFTALTWRLNAPAMLFLFALSFGMDWAESRSTMQVPFQQAKPLIQTLLAIAAILLIVLAASNQVDVSGFIYQGF